MIASSSLRLFDGHMPDLQRAAAEAQGGLLRWNQLNAVTASLSITGAIWQLKGKPDVFRDSSLEAELRRERVTQTSKPSSRRDSNTPYGAAVPHQLLSSSRAAAHSPTFLSSRTSSVRSLVLRTAIVSSMSFACF